MSQGLSGFDTRLEHRGTGFMEISNRRWAVEKNIATNAGCSLPALHTIMLANNAMKDLAWHTVQRRNFRVFAIDLLQSVAATHFR